MVGVLGAALLTFMTLFVAESYTRWRQASVLGDGLRMAGQASQLIHSLQAERGKSILTALGKMPKSDLHGQRNRSDALLKSFHGSLTSGLLPLETQVSAIPTSVISARREFDEGLGLDAVTHSYGRVIRDLISLQNRVASIAPVDGHESVVIGLSVLESAKEGMGRFRFFVANILAKDAPLPAEDYSQFESLYLQVRSNLESPLLDLDAGQRRALLDALSGEDWRSISAMVPIIRSRLTTGKYGFDSQAFFNRATNVLDTVFQIMSSEIGSGVDRVDLVRTRAGRNFFLMLLLGLLTAGLSFAGVWRITRDLSEQLQKLGDRLQEGSQVTLQSATRLAGAAHALSDVSAEQATALQQTLSSLEEIRAMVALNAETASETRGRAAAMSKNANDGKTDMREMEDAIQDIAQVSVSFEERTRASNIHLEEILKLITEVGERTKIINDIVFQTKLLSFNASVEAARAGENGKGFSVVADEIGRLAAVSGGAAAEINELVDKSVHQVSTIVAETRAAAEETLAEAKMRVDQGRLRAEDALESFSRIAEDVKEVSASIARISTASTEQSKGVEEISRAMHRFQETSMTSATSSKSAAAAADSITSLAKGFRRESCALELVLNGRVQLGRFLWSEDYVLGVDAMDDEHRTLVVKMNALAVALENREVRRDASLMAFKDLAAFTARHFADEEAYMRSIGYPGLEVHRKIHAALLANVGDFGDRLHDPDFDARELIEFLYDWLIRHILGSDKKYVAHARAGQAYPTDGSIPSP